MRGLRLGSPDSKRGLPACSPEAVRVGVYFLPNARGLFSPETGQWKKTNGFSARLVSTRKRKRSKRKSGSRGQRRKTECADVHNRIESEGRPSEDAISRLAALARSP